jgi:hypothetical protein
MNGTSGPERTGVAVLLGIALLMFFFPLLVIHVPIAGDQSVSGYDVLSKMTQLQHNFDADKLPRPQTINSPLTNTEAKTTPADIPASLQLAWLLPVFVLAAFTCSALALVDLFGYQKATKVLSLAGSCFGVFAIVDAAIISSDMRTLMTQSMEDGLKDNPFAGLGALVANSFQLRAGAGLYILTGCLLLVLLVTHTHLLSRIRLATV